MKIYEGLPQPYQVFQRNRQNSGQISFKCKEPLRVSLLKGSEVVVPWKKAAAGLSNIPVGGPYTLLVDAGDGMIEKIPGLMIGDLWVLAGQSNMDGCGKLMNLEPPSPQVHCFYYTEKWGIAKDPICRLLDSIDPVHWPADVQDIQAARAFDYKFREIGASLGVRFGKEIVKATGVPIGLIVCSHGGTSIEQWDPSLKEEGGRSLYGSMLRRVEACGGRVAGVLWYQGESNAVPATAGTYKAKMRAFIETVRQDFGAPSLPFLQVQISRFFGGPEFFTPDTWNLVQQVQLELAQEMKNVGIVSAIDSTLDDIIHIDTESLKRVGTRLAELALSMVYGKKTPRNGLMPATVEVHPKDRRVVRIVFKNVRGKLMPPKGVLGFYVENSTGERIAILDARAEDKQVTLILEKSLDRGAKLWYGRGFNPRTNLRDTQFAAPVFGPVVLD